MWWPVDTVIRHTRPPFGIIDPGTYAIVCERFPFGTITWQISLTGACIVIRDPNNALTRNIGTAER